MTSETCEKVQRNKQKVENNIMLSRRLAPKLSNKSLRKDKNRIHILRYSKGQIRETGYLHSIGKAALKSLQTLTGYSRTSFKGKLNALSLKYQFYNPQCLQILFLHFYKSFNMQQEMYCENNFDSIFIVCKYVYGFLRV